MKRLLFVVLLLALASPIRAQTKTVVSGTITDPNGVPYAGGTIDATLIPAGGSPTVNGQPIGGYQPPVAIDTNGNFTMALFCNLSGGGCTPIDQSSTQWQFHVTNPGAQPPVGFGNISFTLAVTITGATQNLSTTLSAAAPVLYRSSSGTSVGCTSNCPYILTTADQQWAQASTGVALGVANNGQFIKFFNDAQRVLGNACIRVVTTFAGGHASVSVYGNAGTQLWTTGSFSTAAATSLCFTPLPITLAASTDYYISWCADNTTAALGVIANSSIWQFTSNTGAPAHTFGVNTTDTCTAGVLPTTIAPANIVNTASQMTIPYVQVFPDLFGAIANGIFVGDSITIGFNGKTPYTSLLSLSKTPWNIANQGQGGEQLTTMCSEFATKTRYQFQAGIPNVVGFWGGTNDFQQAGATVSAVYASLTSCVSQAHAAGAKALVATMLSRTGTNPIGGETLDADKNAYNALIFANTAGADGIVDFSGTPLGCDGCYANTTWFTDGVHPTQLGITTYEAPIWSTAINGLNVVMLRNKVISIDAKRQPPAPRVRLRPAA